MEELSPFLRGRIHHHLGLYKTFLRPLLIGSRVFHHTPFLPLYGQAPWCVLEYAWPDGLRAAAGIFRTSPTGDDEYLFKPRGLRLDRAYRVTRDNSGESFTMPGSDLAHTGIPIRLHDTMSSEMVLFQAV